MYRYLFFLIIFLYSFNGISFSEEASFKSSIKLDNKDKSEYIDRVKISFKEALFIAFKNVSGKLIEIELDDEEGYLVYEIEIVNSNYEVIEVVLDPVTGEILKTGKEENSSDDEYNDKNSDVPIKPGTIKVENIDKSKYPDLAVISFDRATEIALKGFPGKLLKIELEDEEDYLVYEIEIFTHKNQVMEIMIDSGNGEILKSGLIKKESFEDTVTN